MASKSRSVLPIVRTSIQIQPRSDFVCAQCRRQASSAIPKASHLAKQPPTLRRYASSSITDKLRKKIWGTDSPPGQDDPYGSPSVLDKRREQQEKQEAAKTTKTEAPDDDGYYAPATTWDGLKTVGRPGWGLERWDEDNVFEGFMEPTRAESRQEIAIAIHRALVEVWALRQEGLPLVIARRPRYFTDDYEQRLASDTKFVAGDNGETVLVFESASLQQEVLASITPQDQTTNEHGISSVQRDEEYEEDAEESLPIDTVAKYDTYKDVTPSDKQQGAISKSDIKTDSSEVLAEQQAEEIDENADTMTVLYEPMDSGWRDCSFGTVDVKFAILKRVMQLTGKRIPDPEIAGIVNPRQLMVHLVKKPKPKKLAENLMTTNRLADLPNVQIFDRRFTPIDREKEVGRWKVIEEELQARGLPVTGKHRSSLRALN